MPSYSTNCSVVPKIRCVLEMIRSMAVSVCFSTAAACKGTLGSSSRVKNEVGAALVAALATLEARERERIHFDSDAIGGSQAGTVMGTLGYMSPEQVGGNPADARSDIVSFGEQEPLHFPWQVGQLARFREQQGDAAEDQRCNAEPPGSRLPLLQVLQRFETLPPSHG